MLLPSGVTATVKDREVKVKGPKGELSLRVVDGIDVTVDKDGVTLTPKEIDRRSARQVGLAAHAGQQLGRGRVEGLCAAA